MTDQKPSATLAAEEASSDALLRAIAHAPPVRSSPIQLGDRVGHEGRYALRRRLGSGGMGVVYLANDTKIGREVAVKILENAGDDGQLSRHSRLLREARAAGRIKHERIACVYDVGEHDGHPFVVIEYVQGKTLREILHAAQMPSSFQALSIAIQITEGLCELHAHGIAHRDLKPENVMLPASGGLKLLDFGLASESSTSYHTTVSAPTLVAGTLSGNEIAGTPGYMAPEQCEGGIVDGRADIFALGVILFELLAHERPFLGTNPLQIILRTLKDAPNFDSPLLAEVPVELRTLVRHALEKAPSARPTAPYFLEQMQSLAESIQQGSLRSTVTSAKPSPKSDKPKGVHLRYARTWAAYICVASILFVMSMFLRHHHRGPAEKRHYEGMVFLVGGDFTMGRTSEEATQECNDLGVGACRAEIIQRSLLAHDVHIDPFYIDRAEVTTLAFEHWLNTLPLRIDKDEGPGVDRYVRHAESRQPLVALVPPDATIEVSGDSQLRVRPGFDNRPVVEVPWASASMFCAALGKRLPTEAEWEFAARGTTARWFPWGNAPVQCDGVIVARLAGFPCAGLPQATENVENGALDWTPEGVHGLAGNVSEWVQDAFVRPSYVECGRCQNPVAQPNGPSDARIFRGGSWINRTFTRTSDRGRVPEGAANLTIGFRCAVSD